jgi:hypothetical protein
MHKILQDLAYFHGTYDRLWQEQSPAYGKSEGTSHVQIQLLKKRKSFVAFQFLIFVLPAAPAAAVTVVEAATTIGVKAATTIEIASTTSTIAC